MGKFETIIFDLGGVVIDLHVEKTFKAFEALTGKPWKNITQSHEFGQTYYPFERGHMGEEEYRKILCGQLGIEIAEDAFDEAWNAMLGQIPDQRVQWIKELSEKYHLAVLSNTNSIHIRKFEEIFDEQTDLAHPEKLFHTIFYSYEVGHRKPDRGIFEHVIDSLGCDPSKSLFLDDGIENVNAAAEVGIISRHVERNKLTPEHFRDE